MSKEEIEKAKKKLSKPKKYDLIEIIRIFKRNGIETYCITKNETIQTLLQYIKELEADNYECNNIISDYIEERHNLIDIMKADRMEQLDDYVIYLIEKYLKELGVLEDE